MPSSLNGIGVTFNDGTQLQSANEAGGNYVLKTFTAPGTYAKPAGLKAVKVTVIGGGGGSKSTIFQGNYTPFATVSSTPGGTSSFGSFLSATGGAGNPPANVASTPSVAGGAGSGGNLNIQAGPSNASPAFVFISTTLLGGGKFGGLGSANGIAFGGAGNSTSPTPGGLRTTVGGAGGSSVRFISAPSIPGPVAVTVGAGGTFSGPGPSVPGGRVGAAGVVVIEEFF